MNVTSYFPCLYISLRKKFISITWNCQWFWDWIYFTPFIEYRLQNQRILELRLKINFLRYSNHWSILERTSTNFEIFQNNENILPIGVIALLYILYNTIKKKERHGILHLLVIILCDHSVKRLVSHTIPLLDKHQTFYTNYYPINSSRWPLLILWSQGQRSSVKLLMTSQTIFVEFKKKNQTVCSLKGSNLRTLQPLAK